MPKSSEFSRRRFLGSFAGAISCASHFLAGRSLADTFSSGVSQQEDNSTVFYNEKKRLVYHKTASPCKPYVKELYTAGGVQVLRDSPHDHKHHHGLMFAVSVDGVDFWSETPGCGREEPQGIVSSRGGGVNGNAHHILDQCVAWRNATGEVLLDETRAIGIAIRQENPITLVTWRSQLRPPKGKAAVKLGGSHYFGLGMRFVESMDVGGEFLYTVDTPGSVIRGSERLTPGRWCAYVSKVDGKPVTVAMFDHPKNRRPALFFTMRPFAYLSATINLWKQPLVVKAGKTLDLCYGVAVWDGAQEPEQVEEVYQFWLKLLRSEGSAEDRDSFIVLPR